MRVRRVFAVLAVLAVGVAAAVLVSRGGDGDDGGGTTPSTEGTVAAIAPNPFAAGLRFAEPPVLRAGQGTIELQARNGTIELPGPDGPVEVDQAQSYVPVGTSEIGREPGLLAPTLHIEPGQTLDITLDNQLTVPPGITGHSPETCGGAGDPGGHPAGEHGDAPASGPQFTNLHFHGLHVTPTTRRYRGMEVFGDNVLIDLPKGRAHFRFEIPEDHERGTFWYHAHRHGCVNDQVFRGLAGLLVIGDSREELPAPFRDVRTRSLALKDLQVAPDGDRYAIPADHNLSNDTHRTINGLVDPKIDIRPGETQLWRLANVSAGVWYRVALVEPASDEVREPLTLVARDGNTLKRARREREVLLAPGHRVDVLVQVPAAGRRVLKTLRFNQGHLVFGEDVLAEVEVRGPAERPRPLPGALMPRVRAFPKARGEDRRFTFDIKGQPPQFTINDRVFDPSPRSAPLAAPRLGTTETWTLLNRSAEYHPIHIHQDDFRVVSVNDKPVDPGSKFDVVPLPPMVDGKLGKVVIEMPFQDFDGRFVMHCHILGHEDGGMMGRIDLGPPAPE